MGWWKRPTYEKWLHPNRGYFVVKVWGDGKSQYSKHYSIDEMSYEECDSEELWIREDERR